MMNNQLAQLSQFVSNYKGNPEQQSRDIILRSGISQAELNSLQMQANQLYGMARQIGILK